MPRTRRPDALVVATLAALGLVAAMFVRTEAWPAPADYFEYDQQIYLAVARMPFSDAPQVHRAAHAWRLLPPLAARIIGAPLGGPEHGFLVLTFMTFALLPVLAFLWLTTLGMSRISAVTGGAIMALAPPVVGLLAWDVIRVDSVSLLLIFAAAIATVKGRGGWLCAAVAVLALTKETALIAVGFAVAWSVAVDRRLIPAASGAAALAVGIRLFLQWWIPPTPLYPFDNLMYFRVIVRSLSPLYVVRRLLLATVGTWNLLIPVCSVAAVSRRWSGREWALAAAIVVTMLQLVFAPDNERLTAAGYPFVLAWAAGGLDRMRERPRQWMGACLALAQIPWLLELGRVWPAPPLDHELPHFPAIRVVEVAIAVVALGATIAALAGRRGIRTALG